MGEIGTERMTKATHRLGMETRGRESTAPIWSAREPIRFMRARTP